jgi:hypothetical protein
MEDALRASKVETQDLLAKSLYIWASYGQTPDGNKELPSDSVDLPAVLGHVPAFLGINRSKVPLQHKLERIDCGSTEQLWVTGKSMWRTTIGDCSLPKKVISHKLLLGVSSRIPCCFTEENRFRDWPGVENLEQPVKGNCIAILAFAWCYIFSAKWVEIQSSSCFERTKSSTDLVQLGYLNDLAQWSINARDGCPNDIDVDLGDIDDDAWRWWAAILAPGEGWQASIVRFDRIYLSPWSIRLLAQQRFVLRRAPRKTQQQEREPPYDAERTAPSSTMALQYLSDFCTLHRIYGQCFAALSATLLIPYHAGIAQLLLPKPHFWPSPHNFLTPAASCNFQEQGELLPFYMSLSCNIRGVRSLLHGSFFEPTVSCNLVSSWFEGAFEIIDTIVRKREYSRLAVVMGKRQPKIAAVWLGAIILGMESRILSPVRAGMFAVDMLSAAWTCTVHSFIGPRQLIPSDYHNAKISRSDECRLLYLAEAEDHARVPVCPWEPFGDTDLSDTDIEVREHANCRGQHCLQYEDWTWDLQDGGQSAADRGFLANENFADTNDSADKLPFEPPQYRDERFAVSESLSANATRSIFGWLRSTGYPLREREMRRHSWLDVNDDDDDDDDDDEESEEIIESFSSESKQASNVEKWLLNFHGGPREDVWEIEDPCLHVQC